MIKGMFLGTASIPTINRNSQSILLDFEDEYVLVDCGEGIQRRLLASKIDISKISTIFFTHSHIDHVYGVTGVLALILNKYRDNEVKIVAPADTIEIINKLVDMFLFKDIINRINYKVIKENQSIDTANFKYKAFKTYHTETSVGYCFYKNSKSIALLGDVSIPSINAHKNIVSHIKNVDILVLDGVHIPLKVGLNISKDANVKNTYLLPILMNMSDEEVLAEARQYYMNIFVPNDLDTFTVK